MVIGKVLTIDELFDDGLRGRLRMAPARGCPAL